MGSMYFWVNCPFDVPPVQSTSEKLIMGVRPFIWWVREISGYTHSRFFLWGGSLIQSSQNPAGQLHIRQISKKGRETQIRFPATSAVTSAIRVQGKNQSGKAFWSPRNVRFSCWKGEREEKNFNETGTSIIIPRWNTEQSRILENEKTRNEEIRPVREEPCPRPYRRRNRKRSLYPLEKHEIEEDREA